MAQAPAPKVGKEMMSIQEVASLGFAFFIAMVVVSILGWVVTKLGNFIMQQGEPQPAISAAGTITERGTGGGINNRKQAVQHDERLPNGEGRKQAVQHDERLP